MGEVIGVVGTFVVLGWAWLATAEVFKARGVHWLLRNILAGLLAISASIGFAFISVGAGLLPAEGSGTAFDLFSVILGAAFCIPSVAVVFSERKKNNEFSIQRDCRPATFTPAGVSRSYSPRLLTHSQRKALKLPKEKNKEKPITPVNPPQKEEKLLWFVYEDAEGNVTTREVKSWRDDGRYIEGFCLVANDIRTFRKDRILSFISGEEYLNRRKDAPRHIGIDLPEDEPEEILFTGFSRGLRAELEAVATKAGMRVRTKVTQNLMYLVGGKNAVSAKLAGARAKGCIILNEEQFRALVETGELPVSEKENVPNVLPELGRL